jgi:hypothetical protein
MTEAQDRPLHVNRESYNVIGLVDMAVVRLQAERRRDYNAETTIVHDHPYEGLPTKRHKRMKILPCTPECKIYEPGYEVRGINDPRVPNEEQY